MPCTPPTCKPCLYQLVWECLLGSPHLLLFGLGDTSVAESVYVPWVGGGAGPAAAELLQPLVDHCSLASVRFMRGATVTLAGIPHCRLTRCGYTGEDGFEVPPPLSLSHVACLQAIGATAWVQELRSS